MGDQVLGVEAVLPTGEVIATRAVEKSSTGPGCTACLSVLKAASASSPVPRCVCFPCRKHACSRPGNSPILLPALRRSTPYSRLACALVCSNIVMRAPQWTIRLRPPSS